MTDSRRRHEARRGGGDIAWRLRHGFCCCSSTCSVVGEVEGVVLFAFWRSMCVADFFFECSSVGCGTAHLSHSRASW